MMTVASHREVGGGNHPVYRQKLEQQLMSTR
jgi:hypothetical protein